MRTRTRTRASVLALLWLVLTWDQAPIADSPSDHESSPAGGAVVHRADGQPTPPGEVSRHAAPAPVANAPDAESARIRLEPEPNLHAGGDVAR